jgi:hypothetical protein
MSEHDKILGWFIGRLDDTWFDGTPELTYDRDEIVLIGALPEPVVDPDTAEEVRAEACRSRIQAFRQKTRSARIEIARAAEHSFGRKVSWGASCGDQTEMFTTLAAPAMTRLRMPERRVLDTLVASGVAKSRSEALAWCVRLVGTHESDWLTELESAMRLVDDVKQRGPG